MHAAGRVQHEAEVRLVGLVEQVVRRGLAQTHGCKNEVQFLRQAFGRSAVMRPRGCGWRRRCCRGGC